RGPERDEPRGPPPAVGLVEGQDGEAGRPAPAAAGLDRRAGAPVRLLPERHDRDRRRAAREEPQADLGRDQDAPQRAPLPLRDVRGHPAGRPPRRRGDGMSALEQEPEVAPAGAALSRRELLVRSGALVLAFGAPSLLRPVAARADAAPVAPYPVVPAN